MLNKPALQIYSHISILNANPKFCDTIDAGVKEYRLSICVDTSRCQYLYMSKLTDYDGTVLHYIKRRVSEVLQPIENSLE